jgi:hypothetical protein
VSGIFFESTYRPTVGCALSVEIRPIEGPEVNARIKVLHIRDSSSSGFFVIGSKFEEINERSRQNLLVLLDTINRLEDDLSK